MTMPIDNPQELKKLLDLVREAVERDGALREKYTVGQKFRFVQDRLSTLMAELEKKLEVITLKEEKEKNRLSEDEMLVYVYLFNAQGLMLRSWENMLTPKVFYEYSVNRPIYVEKSYIESLVRSKTNKVQHAYLTVALKKVDLKTDTAVDPLGNPMARVKEGSLHFQGLIQFTHNGNDYNVSPEGEILKKPD